METVTITTEKATGPLDINMQPYRRLSERMPLLSMCNHDDQSKLIFRLVACKVLSSSNFEKASQFWNGPVVRNLQGVSDTKKGSRIRITPQYAKKSFILKHRPFMDLVLRGKMKELKNKSYR